MKRILTAFLALSLIFLWGCSDDTASNGTDGSIPAATVDFAQTDSDMFTDRDYRVTWENATAITLNGEEDVSITQAGTYLLSGSLKGSVIVDAQDTDKIQLVLSGVSIYSENSAAICILEADKVFITLAEGTENHLETGETLSPYEEYEVDAAIYCRCDLTINGSGALNVITPVGHGISAKDDLAITGGSYSIRCAGQGLDANDSVRICGGSFTVSAGKDGIHAEHSEDTTLGFVYISGGSFDIEAEGDGISASCFLQIEAGTFDILAGGGYENGEEHSSDNWGQMGPGMGGNPGGGPGGGRPRSTEATTTDASTSMKGLKAAAGMLIQSGSFIIDSADDALHSDTVLVINGGEFTLASGDDGVHAEEQLTVTDCTMEITTCYEGLEALEIYISGGNIRLTATDDGLNAAGGTDSSGTGGRDQMFGGGPGGFGGGSNGVIEISGGTLHINSSGDGIDANGYFLMSGGFVTIVGPTMGDTATLDYDSSATITGGTFIGTGSSMMAQTFSDSKQGVFACKVGNQSAGTRITLKDKDGNILFDYTPKLSFAVVILSSPDLKSGEEYTITVGSNSGTLEAN